VEPGSQPAERATDHAQRPEKHRQKPNPNPIRPTRQPRETSGLGCGCTESGPDPVFQPEATD
jgi:hypothetical protein